MKFIYNMLFYIFFLLKGLTHKKKFDNVYKNKIDSWAYPWNLSLWYNKKVVLTPRCNLVKNIGFGNSTTHTFNKSDNLIYPISKLKKPYEHPHNTQINILADNYVFKCHFRGINYFCPYRFFYFVRLLFTNQQFVLFKLKKYPNLNE